MRIAVLCLAANLGLAGTGETLFQTHCAGCHGPKGDGGRGSNLAVRKLPRAPDDAALSAIIALGIPGTQMPATRMTEQENRQLVAYVRTLGQAQTAAPVAGDRANGERIFWTKANCGACHTVGARGGRTGPDLTDVGTRRSPAHLRTSLVDPEADVPETFAVYRRIVYMPDNFLQVRLQTNDGRQITGVRINEDSFTIQVRDYSDRIFSFRKDELRRLDKDWGKSPMPSYRGMLSDAEIQDVVAYLASLEGAQ
jgi:putative heme-binding domain-containing protein